MRLGEILIGASIMDAKSLQDALNYALSKAVPVGRAAVALHLLNNQDLNRALDAQLAIRRGLSGTLAVDILRFAHQTNRSFLEALKSWPSLVGKDKIPPEVYALFNEKSLETTKVQMRDDTIERAATTSDNIVNAQRIELLQKLSNMEASPASAAAGSRSAEALIKEGDQLFAANKTAAAEKSYELALRQLNGIDGVAPSKLSAILSKLANLYVATGKFIDAEPLLKQLADLQTRTFGHNSPEVGRVLEDMADLNLAQRRFTDAGPLFDEALLIAEQQAVFDASVAGRLLKKMTACTEVANPKDRSRIGELAIDARMITAEVLQTALQTAKQTGEPVGMVLRSQKSLDTQQVESIMFSQLLIGQGAIPQPVAVRALKVCTRRSIPLRQLCEAGQWLGQAATADERLQALVIEQEKLVTAESTLGPDHPEVMIVLERLADIHLVRKDRSTAERLFKRALATLQKSADSRKSQLARISEKLSVAYCQQGKFIEAQPILLKSLEYRRAGGESQTPEVAKCLWLMAKIEVSQFNHAIAMSFFRNAKSIFDWLPGNQCPRPFLEEMVACGLEVGLWSDIEAALRHLATVCQQEDGESQTAAEYLEHLGDLYASTGRPKEAKDQYARAAEIYKQRGVKDKHQSLSRKLSAVS